MMPRLLRACLLLLPLLLAACRDSKVATYRIPKEADAPATTAPSAAETAGALPAMVMAKAGASLEWTAPAGWKTKTKSSMRKGSYTIGDDETGADMAITAFPGDVGGNLANVNRWRSQLDLPPIAENELAAALTPVEANGLKMLVVDLAGGTKEKPLRMLGAIVPFDHATWFFKLTGPDALVAGEKSVYLEFLQTVKPAAGAAVAPEAPVTLTPPAPAMSDIPVTKADGPALKWVAPAHWQSKPASGMRKATYAVTGDDGSSAELAVTAFPGSVGGELANVNRWRGQLSLPPIAESDLAGAITRQTVNGLAITLVDIAGGSPDKPVRLLGAIVPSNGANWFFKFTGPAALVAKEQASFLALVQTLQAP